MKNYLSLALRIVIAIILLQTLFFKFTGHPDSVDLFTQLGVEPFGRIGTGVLELITSILLFIPRKIWLGALMAMGTMAGAIMGHLTILGIEFRGDGGLLFSLAVVTFLSAVFILWNERKDIPFLNL